MRKHARATLRIIYFLNVLNILIKINESVLGKNESFVRNSCLARVSQAPLRAYHLTDGLLT